MTTLPTPSTPYYGGGQVKSPADTIVRPVAPSTADNKHNLGTIYVNSSGGDAFILVSKAGGVATWEPVGGGGGGSLSTLTTQDSTIINPIGGNINLSGDNLFLKTTGSNVSATATVSPVNPLTTGFDCNIDQAFPTASGLISMRGAYTAAHGVPIEFVGSSNTVTATVQLAPSAGVSLAASAGVASFNNANFNVDANGYVSLIGLGGAPQITPYIVGPAGTGGAYTTIQAALNSAHSLSVNGAQIYIQPKSDGSAYTENLTLYANQMICSFSSNANIAIIGNHIPPSTGSVAFQGIYLQTSGSSSAIEAGSITTNSAFIFDNCEFNIASGFVYHAAGSASTGSCTFLNCRDSSANNGILNGSSVSLYVQNSVIGTSTTNCLCNIFTGYYSTLGNSGTFTVSSGANYFWNCGFDGTLVLNNSSHGFGFKSTFVTSFNNSNPCVNIGASAQASFFDCTFLSNAAYAVTGTGTLVLDDCGYGGQIDPGLSTTISGTRQADTLLANTLVEWGVPGTNAVGNLTSDTNFAKISSETATTGILLSGNGQFNTTNANGVGIGHGGGLMIGDGTLITMSPVTSPFQSATYSAGQFTLVSGTVTVATNIFNGQNPSNCFVVLSACYNASNQGFLRVSITAASGFTITSTNGSDGSSYGWFAYVLSTFVPLEVEPEAKFMKKTIQSKSSYKRSIFKKISNLFKRKGK